MRKLASKHYPDPKCPNCKHSIAGPAFLSRQQLANRWGMSYRTLNNWAVLNKGPTSILIGGTLRRYELAAVIAYEQASGPPPCEVPKRIK